MSDNKPKPRLFLSYGRRDAAELANRLRADLEKLGQRQQHALIAQTSGFTKTKDEIQKTEARGVWPVCLNIKIVLGLAKVA